MASNKRVAVKLNSPFVLLLIAAALAGAVAWAAYYYLQQREATMKAELAANGQRQVTPKVSVVVPRVDVAPGAILDNDIFVARPIDADLVDPDTVLVDDFDKLRGQKLAKPLLRGRPLRITDVVAPEVKDVSSILPPGHRALTIEIDNLNSIAQTLRPNNRIDVFLIGNPNAAAGGEGGGAAGGGQGQQALLFMQNMQVLATGTEFHDLRQGDEADKMARPGDVPGKEAGFDTVTLLVTPAQAARLLLGQKMGSFRVALRGSGDRDPVRMAALRGSDVLPVLKRGRDAGIEFIVGGRGNDLVSELSVPPSQLARPSAQPAQAPEPAPGRPASESNRMTISVPMYGSPRAHPAQDD